MDQDSRNYSARPSWLQQSSQIRPRVSPVLSGRRRSQATPAKATTSSSYSGSTDEDDSSPPIPPKPAQPLPILQDKGPFTLPEFVEKFGRRLPLCVSVERGWHSDDERQSIAMGDTYNLHLAKRSKVIELRDASGTTYNIPLSSSFKFAPVFRDTDEGESDKMFERVADVVNQKPLPRLLRATKTFSKDDKSIVEKNEIFVVQKVISPPLRKKTLQVYSVLYNREKILPSDCEGAFTADPYATRLHLPDIVSLFIDHFPLQVRVYPGDNEFSNDSDFPFHLSSEVSELTEIRTETSLVASTHWQESQPQTELEEQRFIEIPVGLEIEVSIIHPDQDNTESDLFQQTKSLLEDFDSAKIHTISSSSSNLTSAPRQGFEREGVEFEEQNRVYDVVTQRSLLKHRLPRQEEPTYAEVISASPRTPERHRAGKTPPPRSPKPQNPRTLRFTPPATPSKPADKKKNPPPVAKKSVVGRVLSVDCAGGERGEGIYQPLRPTHESEVSSYVTLNRMLPRESVTTTASAGDSMDTEAVLRDLISRIRSLEQQVAVLTDRLDELSR